MLLALLQKLPWQHLISPPTADLRCGLFKMPQTCRVAQPLLISKPFPLFTGRRSIFSGFCGSEPSSYWSYWRKWCYLILKCSGPPPPYSAQLPCNLFLCSGSIFDHSRRPPWALSQSNGIDRRTGFVKVLGVKTAFGGCET